MKRKFKRVYRHYMECEEYASPMWKALPPEEREGMPEKSAALMIDSLAFEVACARAVNEWPNSAEVNLTATVINHQAWLGHAACCINHGASEDLTRLGWRMLTEEQQAEANAAADRAIKIWSDRYVIDNPSAVKR